MGMDKRLGREVSDTYKRESSGLKLDSGPFIGKVKNNLDPTRGGRLQVYIPDLNTGNENDPDNWRTVSWASPFFGTTSQPDTNKQNSFKKVRHSYGMWMVPPDIGNLVLCTFVLGDPNRGFWFACIPNQLGHHMIPGIAGSVNVDAGQISDPKVKSGYKNNPTVVSEFNENDEAIDWANFINLKKPIHEEQLKILIKQGLDEDYVRGIVSSSSQRETPSFVFGISTPGRPINDPAEDPNYKEKLQSGDLKESDYAVSARKGGHQFVMDDGNWQGKDQLIRLRTAGGHQILMNDSERVMYIANGDGSVWMEFTGPGHINVYSGSGINIRTQGDLNLHADKNININAGENINVAAGKEMTTLSPTVKFNATGEMLLFGGDVKVGSSGAMSFVSSGTANLNSGGSLHLVGSNITLNDGGGATVNRPTPLKYNKLTETGYKDGSWATVDGGLSTIVPIAPAHEPWGLHKGTTLAGVTTGTGIRGSTFEGTTGSGNGVTSGPAPTKELPVVECKGGATPTDPGPQAAQNAGVKNPVNKSYLNRADSPSPTEGVGPLTPEQTKALITQIGWNESGWKYNIENQYNYLGKYQTGAAVLVDQGYIKRDAYQLYGNKAVNYPTSWIGKDGISSKETYLNSGGVQEKVMLTLLKSNYSTLIRTGAIKEGDDQCAIAGMLAASHLIGAGGAKKWRQTGGGQDANGTTGTVYYNMGRYAVDVLAAPATAQA
jgi:hypothetical protein